MHTNNGDTWNLEVIEVPFSIKHRGVTTRYILREASEPAVMAYRAEQFKGVSSVEGPDGQVKITADLSKSHHVHESKLMLLGDCIYQEGSEISIGTEALRGPHWPHRLLEKLFNKVEDMSLLKRDSLPPEEEVEDKISELQTQLATIRAEKEKEKNSQSAGTGTTS